MKNLSAEKIVVQVEARFSDTEIRESERLHLARVRTFDSGDRGRPDGDVRLVVILIEARTSANIAVIHEGLVKLILEVYEFSGGITEESHHVATELLELNAGELKSLKGDAIQVFSDGVAVLHIAIFADVAEESEVLLLLSGLLSQRLGVGEGDDEELPDFHSIIIYH